MSYTNHTTHYELPQWVRDDKPTFLSDMNGAFDKIDRALHDNASAVGDTDLEVDRVEAKVDGYGDRLDTVEVKVTSLETSQTALDGRITHNSNDINTINSLIGNGEPTTQDKTIIGAINELAASGTPAEVNALKEKVGTGTLDTVSQNCVGAINEVNTKVGTAQSTANTADSKATANANKIGADPLTTTAQTLTGAINEINAKPSGGGDTVTITPALQSGTKVADYTINGVAGSLYAPTGGGGGQTEVLNENYTGEDINEVAKAIYRALYSLSEDRVAQATLIITGSNMEVYRVAMRYTGGSIVFTSAYVGLTSGFGSLIFTASMNQEDPGSGSFAWRNAYVYGVTAQEATCANVRYTSNGQNSSGLFTGNVKVLA